MLRLIAVAALTLSVACSNSTGYGSNPPPPPPPPVAPPPPPPPTGGRSLTVQVKDDDTFRPTPDTVAAGSTVTFSWGTGTSSPHNVTFEDGVDNSTDKTTGTHTRMFNGGVSATHYRYRCTFHSGNFTTGMSGEIVVLP